MKKLRVPAAPHIIVPTIAGSGSEVSCEALILNEDADSKISFTVTDIVAEAVIVDPLLTTSVPEDLSIQGALTAAGQCIESLFLQAKNDEADKLSMEAVKLIAEALGPYLSSPSSVVKLRQNDVMLREKLSLASVYSSIASVSTGFGAAHSLGLSVASVSSTSSHLAVCAGFLPAVLDHYALLVDEESEENESLVFLGKLMQAILEILNVSSQRNDPSLSAWFSHALKTFKLPDAHQLGFDDSMVKHVVDNATKRLENVAKTDSLFIRRDIDTIVQGVVTIRK